MKSEPTILISGAAGGVGKALTRIAGEAGWRVVGVCRRDDDRIASLYDAWLGTRDRLAVHVCDLAVATQVETLLDALGEEFCPDVIVHLAAGVLDIQPIHRVEWAEYQRHIDGTIKPVVQLTQPLLKRMSKSGHGQVIAVLSSVVMGAPPRGFAAYTTAKYALAGYMKSLAVEYAGRGITANTVSPGTMNTGLLRQLPSLMLDQMREALPGAAWIDPAVVAKAILWFASQEGQEMTGCNLPITAGATM